MREIQYYPNPCRACGESIRSDGKTWNARRYHDACNPVEHLTGLLDHKRAEQGNVCAHCRQSIDPESSFGLHSFNEDGAFVAAVICFECYPGYTERKWNMTRFWRYDPKHLIYIHPRAEIGNPPEMDDWKEGDKIYHPVIGDKVRINAFCTVDSGYENPTRIGDGSFLLAHAHVGHDAQIGSSVTLATGSIIGGYAEVGDGSKLGLGAVVLPYRRIGKNCTIGAGSVVTKDVPDGETWCGNPAKPVTNRDPRPHSERVDNPVENNPHNEVFLEVKAGE
jgi:acetyltransferase-like isoleucine patch superfamily enzyme